MLLWDEVAEYTKSAQEKGLDPGAWAVYVTAAIAGAQLPSPELAEILAIRLSSSDYNAPIVWKYVDKALSARLASAMLLLALLSSKVIPSRRLKPMAYRLYMELLRRHAFSLAFQIKASNFKKVMVSVDNVLHLSQAFGIQACEPGVLAVEFTFCAVWQLLDAALDDEGLLDLAPEKKSKWETRPQDMEVDRDGIFDEKKMEYSERLHKINCVMAIEVIAQFLQHKQPSGLLCLASENMPSQWRVFTQRLHLLVEKSSAFRSSAISQEAFLHLVSDNFSPFCREVNSDRNIRIHSGVNSSIWIPIDLYLEDCIDGSVAATSAIELLSGLVKVLQAINRLSWHDTFLALWMASLRLVQREREPHEGPLPRLDARLCMLLSITTLSIADIIEEEEVNLVTEPEYAHQWKEKIVRGKRRRDLVSCLQVLGDYESLLVPPVSVISAANQAAAKAMMFISGLSGTNGYLESNNMVDKTVCAGNLRHLIVESCISRNLLDTSAYFWPGYINGCINQMPNTLPGQVPSWSTFMIGASLTPAMANVLVATPASSLAELVKLVEIAVSGSDDKKVSAATVLCGASLISGCNIQEHIVRFVVNLLSPPIPVDHTGSDSHLISHGPVLNVVLTGISSVDCVQIFSYHGLVPELAGALMAICEVFGSCTPSITWSHPSSEEVSAHAVFSDAFILLMRLWKFNHPPLEYCIMGDVAPVGSQLTPEYLLLLRNSRLLANDLMNNNDNLSHNTSVTSSSSSMHPIFVDTFPKLKLWYRQHQACLASTLSGLVHGTPVHQNVDSLLIMMFRKMNKGSNQSAGPGTSGNSILSSSSGGPGSEDCSLRPNLPAWEIMEAVPFVVDAALTACSHGRLSPRELATGLKDLADFLPASLATIISYFSAEVTRGVWKPAFMNGTDWPSPAANLSTVVEQIKKIVADTGVEVPSLVAGGSSQATLPLPLAAFVSLTITYKLDKASERFLNLAGPTLESLAASCPWPSMPIVAALWTQKVKRWSDFLIFSASRTVFDHNNDTVVQLLRRCFTAAITDGARGGVGNLLGHGFVGSHLCGGLLPVAPGILYLRIYRCINDTVQLTEEIISLLMNQVKDIAQRVLTAKEKKRQVSSLSLSAAMMHVKVAAALGATFVWLSGGSSLVQALIHEILPSWFLSVHSELDVDQLGARVVYNLLGRGLAYFLVLCGMFAWGIDSMPMSKRRPRVVEAHMEFLVSAFDGNIALGCDWALWKAYVSCLLGLMVECAPSWVVEVEVGVLKRLSKGLRQQNEEELALALLRKGGVGAMGAAAEAIIFTDETMI